jgi:hypothetical protein
MHAEREYDLCLKLFAQTNSHMADGKVAATKLQERMVRNGIGFDDLFDHVCEHVHEYGYQAAHFSSLRARVEASRKPTETFHEENPTDTASHSAGDSRVQVREHTRTSRKGKTFTVRAHWRSRRSSADTYDWRKDSSVDPGNDYEWIEDHERWYCHAGHGRKIRVNGYWRRKARITVKKAA